MRRHYVKENFNLNSSLIEDLRDFIRQQPNKRIDGVEAEIYVLAEYTHEPYRFNVTSIWMNEFGENHFVDDNGRELSDSDEFINIIDLYWVLDDADDTLK